MEKRCVGLDDAYLDDRKLPPCSWKATERVNGRWYCAIHDPMWYASSRAESEARIAECHRAEELRQHKLGTWDALLEACEATLVAIGEEEERRTSAPPTWFESKRAELRSKIKAAIAQAKGEEK